MEKLDNAVTIYLAVAEIQHITLPLHITLQATNRHHELLSSSTTVEIGVYSYSWRQGVILILRTQNIFEKSVVTWKTLST